MIPCPTLRILSYPGVGRLRAHLDLRPCRRRRDWRLFERLPEILHASDPAFVPPIPGEVAKVGGRGHIFSEAGTLTGYLAFREGRPVGRIASILNRAHNEFHGDRTGFFGFFDFADASVAEPLLARVREDLASAGCDLMRGPFSPTQNDECGLQVEGFEARPCFAMPYNPPWYVDVYQGLGLTQARDLLAYELDPSREAFFQDRVGTLVERIRQRLPVTVRPVDLSRLDAEAALVSRLFNESLEEEWNFMPLSVAAARTFAKELAGHLDPEAVLIAEVDGKPAGLSIGLPDLNEFLHELRGWPRWLRLPGLLWRLKTRRCRRGRWAVFGMLPEYRKKGGTILLIYEAIMRGRTRYVSSEMSWTQESNAEVNRIAEVMGLTPSKRYRVYEARL